MGSGAEIYGYMRACVLAAAALPSCSGESVREQTALGLNLSSGAKAAVTEYYVDHREYPSDNLEAGIPPAHEISGKYVSQVAVKDGLIMVTFGNDAHNRIQGKVLALEPDASDYPTVTWSCFSQDIEDSDLLHVCRARQPD